MVITTVIPSIGLMSLALFSYLLPPHNAERLKVMITTLLAFTVFLVEINLHLPRNSDSLPTIQLFYMITMGECMLCFVATLFMVRLSDRGSDVEVPFYVPVWVRRYVLRMAEEEIIPASHHHQRRRQKRNGGDSYQLLQIGDSIRQKTAEQFGSAKRKTSKATESTPSAKLSVHFVEPDGTSFPSREEKSTDNNRVVSTRLVSTAGISQTSSSTPRQIAKMTWGILVKQIDKLCLRLFLSLFILTSVGILLPAYVNRKRMAEMQLRHCLDEGECE